MDTTKLTENELKKMFSLIKRFSETEMDQWELFQFDSQYGKVYLEILRSIASSEENYIDVTHLTEDTT